MADLTGDSKVIFNKLLIALRKKFNVKFFRRGLLTG